jgi:phosphoglycolate phosphatase
MPPEHSRPLLAAAAVMFDLDGTLVHTAPDIAEGVRRMLSDLGLAPVDDATVETWIGDGVSILVHRALTGERAGRAEPELYERGYARFVQHYAQRVSAQSRPYPGVREGLAALQAAGLPLACVTSKLEALTRPLLRDLDLMRCFEVVVAGDTLAHRKPDPRPLLHACAQLGVEPEQTVFVGDSQNDADAARAAGTAFVAVRYGYNGGRDPRTLRADLLLESLEELLPHLEVRPLRGRRTSG